jgi:hypothetical protein
MKRYVVPVFVFVSLTAALSAQAVQDGGVQQAKPDLSARSTEKIPITRIALFSSGVGFFEREGEFTDAVEIDLPFNVSVMDDALKSLTINDTLSKNPSIVYSSEETLLRTLQSLSIDLSWNPGAADLLGAMRGAEVDVYAPNLINGRIIVVEYRGTGAENDEAPFVSLLTKQGVKTIALKDISTFSFKDDKVNEDLSRALDLLLESRSSEDRVITVKLPGQGKRSVSVSYVVPAPVWKVSYRLDLTGGKAQLQGWAIVDNDGDTDWENVELSLVAGRPASFIQRLYAPYRVSRPVLPLSIAGVAETKAYDYGWAAEEAFTPKYMASRNEVAAYDDKAVRAAAPMYKASLGGVEPADAQRAGERFQFTIKEPVSLERRRSAMLPLVESFIEAEKVLVFSGAKAAHGWTINPSAGARLVNTSGVKLPAGPITVFDDGYAGDALIEFFPENEERLVSFGDDLSVQGVVSSANSQETVSVKASKGVMTINHRRVYEKVYVIKNAAQESKNLVVEHSIMKGTELMEPLKFEERTDSVYRFWMELPANGTLSFTVKEGATVAESVTLGATGIETLAVYASSREIPENVRGALQKAVELKVAAEDAAAAMVDAEAELERLFGEQERIRLNLGATGVQSPQGQDYLKRLTDLDAAIDRQNEAIAEVKTATAAAQAAYMDYLAALEL